MDIEQCRLDGYEYQKDVGLRQTRGELIRLVESHHIERNESLDQILGQIIELGFDAEKSDIEAIACDFNNEIVPQFSREELRKIVNFIGTQFFRERVDSLKPAARANIETLFNPENINRSQYTLWQLVDIFSTRVRQGPLDDLTDRAWIYRWNQTLEQLGKGSPGELAFLGFVESSLNFGAENNKSGAKGVLQFLPGKSGIFGNRNVQKMMEQRGFDSDQKPVFFDRVVAAGLFIDFYDEKYGEYAFALHAYHAGPTNVERVKRDFETISRKTHIPVSFTPENVATFGGSSDWKMLFGSNPIDSTKGDFGPNSRNYFAQLMAYSEVYQELLAKNPSKYFIGLPITRLDEKGIIYPCDLESNPHQTDPNAVCENPTLPFPPDFEYLANNRPKLNPKN